MARHRHSTPPRSRAHTATTTTSHRKEPHGPPRQRAAPPLFHTRASVGLSHSHAPTQLTRHDIVIHTQRRPARLTTCAHADVHSHAAAVAPAPPSPRRRALSTFTAPRRQCLRLRGGSLRPHTQLAGVRRACGVRQPAAHTQPSTQPANVRRAAAARFRTRCWQWECA